MTIFSMNPFAFVFVFVSTSAWAISGRGRNVDISSILSKIQSQLYLLDFFCTSFHFLFSKETGVSQERTDNPPLILQCLSLHVGTPVFTLLNCFEMIKYAFYFQGSSMVNVASELFGCHVV